MPPLRFAAHRYQAEIARLRHEHHSQRSRESKLEREFEDLMQENESLSEKLEHLQDAFVLGGDADAQWPAHGGAERGAGAGAGAGAGDAVGDGKQGTGEAPAAPGSTAAAPTATEERLKAALRKVADDNNALREELAAAQEAAERGRGAAGGGGDPDDRCVCRAKRGCGWRVVSGRATVYEPLTPPPLNAAARCVHTPWRAER